MKRHLIIGVTVLILAVVLSGCKETAEVTGDTNSVEIIDYFVTTEWYIPGYGTFQTYSKPGFYKRYPENAYKPRYVVNGTVKNIAGEDLHQIIITVLFCDSNKNQLASENTTLIDLSNNFTTNFTVCLYSNNQYFKNVDCVKFHILAS